MNKLILKEEQKKDTPSTLLRVAEEAIAASLLKKSFVISMARREGKTTLFKMLKSNG